MRWTSWLLVVALCVGAVAGCGAGEKLELRIGLLTPLSGDEIQVETTGKPSVEGAELALSLLEEAGGLVVDGRKVDVVLIIQDDGGTPEGAVAGAKKLINQDRVNVIVGPPYSSTAIPVSSIAEEVHVPMISTMSTNPETTRGKQYAFRGGFIDPFQGRVMASFALTELGVREAAMLYDVGDPYSRGLSEIFAEVFVEAGGEIVASEPYTADQDDFTEMMERIKESGAEVVFMPNFLNDFYPQILTAREVGVDAIFLGGDALDLTDYSEYPELEGTYYSTHWHVDSSSPESQAFVETYVEIYPDRLPVVNVAMTYDVMNLVFEAVRSQQSVAPDAIRDGLASIRDYPGVTGAIGYQGSGDPVKSAVIVVVEDLKAKFFKVVHP